MRTLRAELEKILDTQSRQRAWAKRLDLQIDFEAIDNQGSERVPKVQSPNDCQNPAVQHDLNSLPLRRKSGDDE